MRPPDRTAIWRDRGDEQKSKCHFHVPLPLTLTHLVSSL